MTSFLSRVFGVTKPALIFRMINYRGHVHHLAKNLFCLIKQSTNLKILKTFAKERLQVFGHVWCCKKLELEPFLHQTLYGFDRNLRMFVSL